MLFISPQALRESDHGLFPVLRQLAIRGQISAFCIDEVHAAVEYADSFRPEFGDGVGSIKKLRAISAEHHPEKRVSVLAMSATFRIPAQKKFNEMIGMAPDLVSWGDMDKRSVAINVHIVGSPLNSLSKDVAGAASGPKVRSEGGSENGPEQESVDETNDFQHP